MNLKRFFQPPAQGNFASFAILLLRLAAGAAFMFQGWGKIQHPTTWMGSQAPVPGFLQFLAALSEFGGGFCWILGLITPLASCGIACTMTVAVFTVMKVMHAPFVDPKGGMSYELPLVFLCVALVLLTAGPGRFSADKKIFG